MTVNLGLLVVVAVMAASGAYLLMERSLVRMLLGLILAGNAINLLIITISGGMGNPPILYRSSQGRAADADPLAQAMVLTAIVITMGIAAFILALVYRLFVINRDDDDVEDDTEDVKILGSSLQTAPDRDRSDDPVTGADTSAGDLFDDAGNPLTPEQYAERHRKVIETDLMPDDADVIDEVGGDDEPDGDADETGDGTADGTHPDTAGTRAPDAVTDTDHDIDAAAAVDARADAEADSAKAQPAQPEPQPESTPPETTRPQPTDPDAHDDGDDSTGGRR